MHFLSPSFVPRLGALTALCGVAALLAFAPGCASSGGGASDGFHAASASSVSALQQTELRLKKLIVDGMEVPLPAKPPITLRFDEGGKVAGRSAVNRYFGSYQLGANGAVQWPGPGLGMTRMAGPAPLMELEAKFSRALTATTQLLVSTNGARFRSADAKQSLDFVRP